MGRIVRLSTGQGPPGRPMTEKMDESSEPPRFRFPRARSSCGSTSSRWPSWPPVAWALFTHGDRPARRRRTCRGGRSRSGSPAPRSASSTSASAAARTPSRLADLPFVFGLVFAAGDDVRARRARRHRHRLRPDPPAGARQARSSTSPSSRSPRRSPPAMLQLVAGGADALQPETWVGLYAATLSSGALTILLLGGAIAIAEGDVGRPMLVQMFATDALVTLINASHRDRRRARRRHRPARRPGAARPGPDRLRRLPRLHLRAPAPRAPRVPLRRQPHALAARPRSPRRSRRCSRARSRPSTPTSPRSCCSPARATRCAPPTARATTA